MWISHSTFPSSRKGKGRGGIKPSCSLAGDKKMDSYQATKDEIKRAADIVELIGQFIHLKRAGQNYMGLCPFHSEKDPSFTVSPARQMFHCFGCKKGGDIFAFWMEYHHVAFPQALKDLAEHYHIALPEKRMSDRERQEITSKEALFKINELASTYYHEILLSSERGEHGREYVLKRGFSKDILTEWMLGYAPEGWEHLSGFLEKKGVDLERAVQCGLLAPKKNGGYYDRFRNRILFPIFDMRNRILGFGGRVLDESLPKYLNTPETPIFHKGEILYGLNQAYRKIRESGRAVIVEGYTDVLALRGQGFHEVVATLGTALTRDHIRKLKGIAQEAIVVFDADNAGKLAALKSLAIFMNEGMSSKVMILPDNHDPDSFVRKYGLDGFLDHIQRALFSFDFYLDQKLSFSDGEIEGRVRLLEEMIPVLCELKSDAQRALYARRVAERIGMSEQAIWAELKKWQVNHASGIHKDILRERLFGTKVRYQTDVYLLNVLIHYPRTMDKLLKSEYRPLISDPALREIYDSMLIISSTRHEMAPEGILDEIKGEKAKEIFRGIMLHPPICRDDEVERAVKEFEDRVLEMEMTESIKEAKEKNDIEALNRILKLKRNRQVSNVA